ncbi:hypothetical protein BELL_0469g00010 [Botrytis elliptica]|uniref:Uncharacterized protein n=1 Tax=Botrytis elliptica TaxID=278938 RepID=A0A4Z1JG77_9HELO|nr:hypothetical protein EAE99_010936 [Botrytis elliptica]TGO72304.1 hypothetical protein BELL_0469g00010 [Botrytis elliptica]
MAEHRRDSERDDPEYQEGLTKELKERRRRKERRKMARKALDSKMDSTWWSKLNASEVLAREWMAAEREERVLRSADKWNKIHEFNKITQSAHDRKWKYSAFAEVERKFKIKKAKRDEEKREREHKLEEAWNREFYRWNAELEAAGIQDGRYTRPDEDGVIWSPQSLLNIDNDIRNMHLEKCMPSIQEPEKRGRHCKDCEDEQEVGYFWDEVRRLGL